MKLWRSCRLFLIKRLKLYIKKNIHIFCRQNVHVKPISERKKMLLGLCDVILRKWKIFDHSTVRGCGED